MEAPQWAKNTKKAVLSSFKSLLPFFKNIFNFWKKIWWEHEKLRSCFHRDLENVGEFFSVNKSSSWTGLNQQLGVVRNGWYEQRKQDRESLSAFKCCFSLFHVGYHDTSHWILNYNLFKKVLMWGEKLANPLLDNWVIGMIDSFQFFESRKMRTINEIF